MVFPNDLHDLLIFVFTIFIFGGVKFMVEPLAWRKHIFPNWGPGKISSLSRFVADVAMVSSHPTVGREVASPIRLRGCEKMGREWWMGKWWRVGCWLGLEVWAVEITPCCKEMRFKPSFLLSDHTYSNFFFKHQNADPWLTWKPKVLIDLKCICMFPKLLSEAGW